MNNRKTLEQSVKTALATLHQSPTPHKVAFWNGLLYFIFAGDWPDKHLPAHMKFASLKDAKIKTGLTPGKCADFNGIEFDIIRSLLRTDPNTLLIDGGANYGREGIRYALFRRSLGLAVPTDTPAVIGIEPGPVVQLAWVNTALHDVPEVKLIHAAVSDEKGFTQIGVSETHTLGGSIAIGTHGEWKSLACKSVTIDNIVPATAKHAPIFLKMDVQGAEALVLRGMRETIERQPVTGIFEYAPTIMERMGDTAKFFDTLAGFSNIYELGMKCDQKRALSHRDIQALTDEIKSRPPEKRCTDLLIIDKRLEL